MGWHRGAPSHVIARPTPLLPNHCLSRINAFVGDLLAIAATPRAQ